MLKKERGLKREESVYIAITLRIVKIEEESSLYTESIKPYAFTTNVDSRNWILDSGASRNYSYYIKDFNGIKRFKELRKIRVTGGEVVNVVSYSNITLITTYSTLVF